MTHERRGYACAGEQGGGAYRSQPGRDAVKDDIWAYDIQRDAMTRLTSGGGSGADAIWSPDGRYVIFGSGSARGLFWTRADGASQPQPLIPGKNSLLMMPGSLTPDGKRLAYVGFSGAETGRIWTVPLEDQSGQLKAGKPEQFLETQF